MTSLQTGLLLAQDDFTFGQVFGIVAGIFFGLMVLVFLFLFGKYFKLWLRAFVTRAKISPLSLVFMSLRKVNPQAIVDAKISAVQAGLTGISNAAIEAHYLAGGNVQRVIRAMIAANRALIELDWDTAAATDEPPVPTRDLSTPSLIFEAARDMAAELACERGMREARARLGGLLLGERAA